MGIFDDLGDKRPRRARMGLNVATMKFSYAITGLVPTACKIHEYMYRVMMIILYMFSKSLAILGI